MTNRFLIWCAIIPAALAGPAAAAEPARAAAIQILSATYGGVPDDLRCSALITVRQSCDGRVTCSIAAEPNVCGAAMRDNVPLFATLYVTYACASSDPARMAKAERPFRLELSCAGRLR